MKIAIAIILMVVLVGVFIFSYILNRRTPKPEGCEDMSATCESCQIISCSHHPSTQNNDKGK